MKIYIKLKLVRVSLFLTLGTLHNDTYLNNLYYAINVVYIIRLSQIETLYILNVENIVFIRRKRA